MDSDFGPARKDLVLRLDCPSCLACTVFGVDFGLWVFEMLRVLVFCGCWGFEVVLCFVLESSRSFKASSSVWALTCEGKLGASQRLGSGVRVLLGLSADISGEDWGQDGVVQWLGQKLGSQPEAIPVLLELLVVFPKVTLASTYPVSLNDE